MRTDQSATFERDKINLTKYAADNKVDIICIQEPYIYQRSAAALDSKYRTYTAGEAQSRTAITKRN